jgi:hypothetical protein
VYIKQESMLSLGHLTQMSSSTRRERQEEVVLTGLIELTDTKSSQHRCVLFTVIVALASF